MTIITKNSILKFRYFDFKKIIRSLIKRVNLKPCYLLIPGPWLKEINSSSLVIAAEEDIITLPTESEELAKMLPDATFTLIPGAHSSPIEQSQKINQLILQFCS
ncbi:lipolytic protein [Legionella lansingensis]|uniref:Lipolytic enzyme n=1 Tax=Legionella lansingensis TaxID=45067 RepID=A0A0W0VQ73_9GAMM|nr:alpha/beta hydrolase [Legionella lansingensis]KTD21945.1 lipolytic enzyme [Legionella lansingensis]SNV46028.1 lipolytic protein [Legionella lansingensis]